MKSERRHELQENELAAYLGRINAAIEPYSKLIAVAAIGIVVALVATAIYRSRASENRSDATFRLIRASGVGDAEELAVIAEQYPDTAPAAWALLYQADDAMSQGMMTMFTSRSEAEALFDQAVDAYQAAIERSDDRLIRSRAHFGLARIAEAKGELDEAVEQYKRCAAAEESEAMVRKAESRIESLAREDTRSFITWFGDQDFSPADPSLPPTLPDGTTLPDDPDSGFSGFDFDPATPDDPLMPTSPAEPTVPADTPDTTNRNPLIPDPSSDEPEPESESSGEDDADGEPADEPAKVDTDS